MAPTRLLSCVCARPPLPCSRARPELHAGDHVDLQNRRPPCAATHTTTTPERTRPSWHSRSRGCRCSSSELACRRRLEPARTSTSLYAILQIWWPAGLPQIFSCLDNCLRRCAALIFPSLFSLLLSSRRSTAPVASACALPRKQGKLLLSIVQASTRNRGVRGGVLAMGDGRGHIHHRGVCEA
jgi:hypothetical protein